MPERIIKINEADSNTTIVANTPNVTTPILIHTVPLGVERILKSGTRFRLKLLTSSGTDIARTSTIYIARRRPEDDLPKDLYKFSYAPFYSLTLAQQLDEESYKQQLSVILPLKGILYRQQDQLILLLNSPDTIYPSLCAIEFEMTERTVPI